MNANAKHVPDAVQRDSVAPLIRDRRRLRVGDDSGSAAQRFALRCARETLRWETKRAPRVVRFDRKPNG
jgi:hypothetical protein